MGTRTRGQGLRALGRRAALCLAAWPLTAALAAALAAPFTPASDAEVVERLPGRAGQDPALRSVEALRRQLAAAPGDARLRVEVARRYFDLALAQGDPRYAGYASGALAPLAADPPREPATAAAYWTARGILEQYLHGFEPALDSLARAAQLDPRAPEPPGWRAAIFMVQARYAEALGECERLQALAHPLWAAGCRAYARAATGHLADAYGQLAHAAATARDAPPGLRLWAQTRLAEMAQRQQRHTEAERHFRLALDTGVTDQFLLAAYADFLVDRGRAREALALLGGWERSDILLLRLALAGQAVGDARAGGWIAQLRERFADAARRGDALHEWEAARFELDLARRPDRALPLAVRNYAVQKEPRDAFLLMRAALAAGRPAEAAPALAWLRASRYEDPAFTRLAGELAAAGGGR